MRWFGGPNKEMCSISRADKLWVEYGVGLKRGRMTWPHGTPGVTEGSGGACGPVMRHTAKNFLKSYGNDIDKNIKILFLNTRIQMKQIKK
jgi:hypothetical protein